MALKQTAARQMAHRYFPSFKEQRARVEVLDSWLRGEQEGVLHMPNVTTQEYKGLAQASPSSWADLIVKSVVQNAELTGMLLPGTDRPVAGWRTWQANRMDAKQARLYYASAGHGIAFVWAERGADPLTGGPMSRYHLASGQRMAAFYADDDEWPMFAIDAVPRGAGPTDPVGGWDVQLIDEQRIYTLRVKGDGYDLTDWSYVSDRAHGASVCPVVAYAPNTDIDGRANSDLQGLIPLLSRIDQDTFDRLIVQRFGAWKVRYIAGMAKPTTDEEAAAQKLRLRVEDILISEDHDAKFGTLDATDIAGFISARDSDLRDLSALSQTPPHHMLGLSSNLQAESLAAAESGLQRKSRGHRMSWGESNEQLFRLDGHLRGDRIEAQAFELESRWRDTESRSLEQAALSLGMLATNLKVPVELLWERIPGWSSSDVERAKSLVESGAIDTLIQEAEALAREERERGTQQAAGNEG